MITIRDVQHITAACCYGKAIRYYIFLSNVKDLTFYIGINIILSLIFANGPTLVVFVFAILMGVAVYVITNIIFSEHINHEDYFLSADDFIRDIHFFYTQESRTKIITLLENFDSPNLGDFRFVFEDNFTINEIKLASKILLKLYHLPYKKEITVTNRKTK